MVGIEELTSHPELMSSVFGLRVSGFAEDLRACEVEIVQALIGSGPPEVKIVA